MNEPAPYLNTREVADYLRLGERKIYDLVQNRAIPCVKVSGKWLFPKAEVDAWVKAGRAASPMAAPPPVMAGSRDPLLDWCLSGSGCGLAVTGGGSLAGLEAMARGLAMAAGIHVLDPASGTYNQQAIRAHLDGMDVVAIEWARREQGLVVAAGNPLNITRVGDLTARGLRLAQRDTATGTHVLLRHLLDRAGEDPERLRPLPAACRTGFDVGLAVLDGSADTGLTTRAVAHQLRLDFVPLAWERFDLVIGRHDYFEPPFQALLAFANTGDTLERAAQLRGYECSGAGTVRYNAPRRTVSR